MIDDDIDLSRREAALERERSYLAGRRRERSRFGWRRRERVADDIEADSFGVAGFGLGGGGAALVVIGLLLMAIAYFGIGLVGPDGFSGYDAGSGFSPAVDRFSDGYSGGAAYAYDRGGDDLFSQRPMMFMGGGFLFLAGWILVVASRLRTFLADDSRL